MASYGHVGDILFSETGRACSTCGWQTFWARAGNFANAVCEWCGACACVLCCAGAMCAGEAIRQARKMEA